ncbi:hypothetical protein [Lumpy skin disease virus]|nr:hypothetical protein [Lumpy skin disease virus]
MSEKLKKS